MIARDDASRWAWRYRDNFPSSLRVKRAITLGMLPARGAGIMLSSLRVPHATLHSAAMRAMFGASLHHALLRTPRLLPQRTPLAGSPLLLAARLGSPARCAKANYQRRRRIFNNGVSESKQHHRRSGEIISGDEAARRGERK